MKRRDVLHNQAEALRDDFEPFRLGDGGRTGPGSVPPWPSTLDEPSAHRSESPLVRHDVQDTVGRVIRDEANSFWAAWRAYCKPANNSRLTGSPQLSGVSWRR
jgi:hypothetical protein